MVFGSSFLSNPLFERRRGEKGDKRLGLGKDQVLGWVSSHFLLLCDQATYKLRFKEAKVRKQNPSFIFCDFDVFGENPKCGIKVFLNDFSSV